MDFQLGDKMPDDYQPDFVEEPAAPEPQQETVQAAPAPAPVQQEQPVQAQAAPDFKIGDTMPEGYQPDFIDEPATPAAPKTTPWGSGNAIIRGAVQGFKTSGQNFGEAAEAINGVFGGDESNPLGSIAKALTSKDGEDPNDPWKLQVPSFTDISGPGTALTYGGEQLGSGVVSTAPSLATGLAGGVAGEAVGGPAGGVVGAFSGAAIPSVMLGIGDVYSSLKQDAGVQEALKSGKISLQDVQKYGVLGGVVTGAIDAVGAETLGAGRIMDAAGMKLLKDGIMKSALHGLLEEGGTEAAQEIISQGVQAAVGGNADLGNRVTSVIDNFLGGAITGGAFGAGKHVITGGEHKAEDTGDTAPPGTDTPGSETGSGTAHPPPNDAEGQFTEQAPVKEEAEAEPVSAADAKSVDVEEVQDVPADIASTMAPEEEGTGDEDDLEADPDLSPEEQQQQQQDLAARTSSQVDPTISAAADVANKPTDQALTKDDIIKQVQAVAAKAQADAQAKAEQQALAAQRVPAVGAAPSENIPGVPPVAAQPEENVSAEPAVTAQPEEILPAETAAAPDVVTGEEAGAPVETATREPVAAEPQPELQPEPAAEPEPVAEPEPEPVAPEPEPPKAPMRQYLSHIGRALAEDVRTRFARDSLSEHPELRDTIEEVAHGITKNLGKGVAPAAVVREHAEAAAAEVRKRIEARTEAAKAAEVTAGVTAANISRQVNKEAQLNPEKGQQRPRVSRVTGEKPAEAIATEKPERTMKRIEAKPEAERTAEEQEWYDLYKKKAKIKGGRGEAPKKRRAPLEKRMAEIREGWVKAQSERDVQKESAQDTLAQVKVENAIATKTDEERAGEKTAEEVAKENREKIARELAEREAADKLVKTKKEKERVKRKQEGRDVVKKALDATPLDPTKDANIGAIEAMVARVKSSLASAGMKLPDQMSRAQYSAEENLAIFANNALENRKKDPMAVHFIALAKDQLENDSAASMYDLLQQTSSTQGISYNDALHGPELSEEEEAEAADRAAERQMKAAARITEELPTKPKYTKLPNVNSKGEIHYGWTDKDGSKKSITTKKHMSAAEAIDWTQQFHPPGRGIMGYIRKMHLARLREMVGDVPVLFVTDADFQHLFGKNSRGVYMHSNVEGMASGQKGIVLINTDEADKHGRGRADLAHVVEHELSHAATVYAVDTDYRGTKQIVTKMLNSLKAQLQAAGVRDLDMINGLKSPKEFVADAYSDPKFQQLLHEYDIPTDLADKLGLPSNKQPKWWDAVVAMVRNSLNLERMGKPGRSYLEGMMTLHPDLMMSEREQMRRAKTDWYLGADNPPTSPGYSERLTRSGARQLEFLPSTDDVDNNLQAALYKRVWGKAKEYGRGAWRTFATSEDLKRRVAGYFNNNPDNIYSDAVDHMMKSGEEGHKQSESGVLTAAKFARFRQGNKGDAGIISRLMFHGSQFGYHPAYALSHATNSHISKKGVNHTQLRAQHAKGYAEFQKLSPKAKQMFHELDDHFRKMYNDKNQAIVSTYVEQALDSGHLVVPKGVSRQEVENFIFSGDMNKPDATLSPNEKLIKQAMGKSFDDLQQMTALHKIKGVYAPFMRSGSKIFTARKDVDLPAGAVRGREFANSQEIIFKDKKDFKKYLASTDDVVTHRFTRATDPTTGKNVDANGKPLRLIDDVNYMPYYHARVLNRVVRMDDNEANLEHQRKQYEAKGYKTTAVSEVNKELHSDNDMLPQHVRRLARTIESGKGSAVTKKTAVGGLLDAYYRQMAGSTTQQRLLKRGGDIGYSKDLLNTLIKTNSADSHQLAALTWRGRFAEDDAKLDAELERRRVEHDPNLMKFQAAVKEMRNRRDAFRDQSTTFGRISQVVRSMSYIKNLGGLMFSIMNAVQPLGTTMPVLAGRHRTWRAMYNMMNGYYRVSGGRTALLGGLETLKQAGHMLKIIAPTLYGSEILPREGAVNYHTRLVNHLKQNQNRYANAQAYLAGMKELDDRGWGADSGLDMEDLSDFGKTRGEKLLNNFARIFQQLPKAIEANNRYVTMMAAIDGEIDMARREAKKAGVTPNPAAIQDRAVRYATTTVERTQGGYNQKNNPNFITSPSGKMAFQYKPYGLMSGQLFWGTLLNSFKGNSPEVRREARRTVVRMSAMTTLMAGAFGLPLMELGRSGWLIAQMMGAVDGDWDDEEAKMQEWLSQIFGKGPTEDLLHGLSREMNIDLSKRLGMDSMVSFGSPKSMKEADVESWIIHSFGGAPANMIIDAYNAYQTGDWTKYPVPRMAKDMGAAWKGANVGQKSKSGATTYDKPTGWTTQRVLQSALGIPSADEARKYEAGGSALKYKRTQAANADRQATEQKWLNATTGAERSQIWADIRTNFNPGKKGKERITYSDLLTAQKRRASAARTKDKADKKAAREEASP